MALTTVLDRFADWFCGKPPAPGTDAISAAQRHLEAQGAKWDSVADAIDLLRAVPQAVDGSVFAAASVFLDSDLQSRFAFVSRLGLARANHLTRTRSHLHTRDRLAAFGGAGALFAAAQTGGGALRAGSPKVMEWARINRREQLRGAS